ncbi:hypothetical protein F2Q68_00029187 [Brassica cretica]|uniref:Uncharacterized protein n=1 Tax=Brassica cretica TaxID=69181 RepID=A0A8S9GDX7_BRACR|nr:hypothetical protein F2Q68_00029187 [Brassica cretica]
MIVLDEPTKRPPGVKAAKGASGKRSIGDHQAVAQFQTMCSIKEKDLAVKEKNLAVEERVSKISLLDSLISKKDSLSEAEEALKQKLLTEMLSPKECACVDVAVDESSMCTLVMGPLRIVIRSHECACVDVAVDESSMCHKLLLVFCLNVSQVVSSHEFCLNVSQLVCSSKFFDSPNIVFTKLYPSRLLSF